MITSNQEDYIKIIYAANISERKVSNKFIASRLGITPPSVTEMISKLIDNDKIEKDKVLGYVLTKEGVVDAKNIIRKHRLWEVFLVNYLGYSWDEVHEDAEVLEHVTSNQLSSRLNEFLGSPTECPHGSIIYGNAEEPKKEVKFTLDALRMGERGIICEVLDQKDFLHYLEIKGMKMHDEVLLVDIDNYDGTRTLKIDNRILEISAKAAQDIGVHFKDFV